MFSGVAGRRKVGGGGTNFFSRKVKMQKKRVKAQDRGYCEQREGLL